MKKLILEILLFVLFTASVVVSVFVILDADAFSEIFLAILGFEHANDYEIMIATIILITIPCFFAALWGCSVGMRYKKEKP